MLVQLFAVLALCGSAVSSGKISQTDYHFRKPARHLESALQRFERDLAGKRGASEARSSKPKEIVVVGSKIKESRSRSIAGGFKSVSGMDSETDVVEFREGGEPPSLRRLKAAIRSFESAAGPRSPCVGRCRTAERRCLSRCRRALRQRKTSGRCVCAHIRARCLAKAAKRGKCHPPDPGRRLRR